MAEYIEREAAQEVLKRFCEGMRQDIPRYPSAIILASKDIDEIPAADVVEVVRCKDCKHWNEFMNGQNGKMFGDCKLVGEFRNEDDFCSYGERRDTNGHA